MRVLVTGAKGFLGKNLVCALENIALGKNRTTSLKIDEVFSFDLGDSDQVLLEYCKKADFVFNLAGVNRPQNPSEFMEGNRDFGEKLLSILEKEGNCCPVMLSSSVQATLEGRYAGSAYGESKREGEKLFFEYGKRTGARVLVYRFVNLFGKWCKPNYNSAVATFCHNVARDLPITVNDENAELNLCYADDVVEEMLSALDGREHREGEFCCVPVAYSVKLGYVADLIKKFGQAVESGNMPAVSPNSFEDKLLATFMSYLPSDKIALEKKMNMDARGSFTELFRSEENGQFSINVSYPGIVKGNHWHDTKWEIFTVVSGKGLIRQRKIGDDEVIENYVSGENITSVYILPGYTHEIINLSDSENLVTVMWANRCFDPDKPDTFAEKVIKEE